MAKRNRYRELEGLMTKVILGEAAVFILYLIFAYKRLCCLQWINKGNLPPLLNRPTNQNFAVRWRWQHESQDEGCL